METLRAVNSMANAEAAGLDGSRSPGGAELNRRAPGLAAAANKAIILLNANGLNPDDDRATQIRLAAAVDRQIVGAEGIEMNAVDVTRKIMNDVLLQEAAARHLEASGERDPLAHVASAHSNRDNSQAFELLNRNNISAATIFRSASADDLKAISAGQFDQIKTERAQFAVGTVLALSDAQMNTRTAGVPQEAPARNVDFRRFPATGLGAGPQIAVPATAFGRKGAER